MIQESNLSQKKQFYRSTQYRSASYEIKPNKFNIDALQKPIFQIFKTQTAKLELKKKKKHLFQSQQNLNKLNQSQFQNLSNSKQFQVNTTFVSQRNPEEQAPKDFSTCTYVQSFEELMDTEQKASFRKKKINALSLKLEFLKQNSKLDRIQLPTIIEYQNSEFTALDPIRIPINVLKEDIQKTRKAVYQCPNQLDSIRFEMKSFKQNNLNSVSSFSEQFMIGIKKLWSLLRQNNVYQQSFVMRTKRELRDLKDFLPQFKQQLVTTQDRQLQVQVIIFETSPFQLKLNEPEKSINSTKDQQTKESLPQPYF